MFCRIYVTGNILTIEGLLNELSKLLNEKLIDHSYIEMDACNISVTKNAEYDNEKQKEFPDGFLYFKMSIEVDIYDRIAEPAVSARIVTKILSYLWLNGYPAVASCQFEEILPEKGGYNSPNIPWMK